MFKNGDFHKYVSATESINYFRGAKRRGAKQK